MALASQKLHSVSDVSFTSDGMQYDFGAFTLGHDGTLLRGKSVVPVPPKELALLKLLVSLPGQLIPAEMLRQRAWGDVHVSADSLPRCISSLRARLECEECIQTVYKRGYRFNLPVKKSETSRSIPAVGPVTDSAVLRQSDQVHSRWTTRTQGLQRLAIFPFTAGPGVPPSFGSGIAEETMLRLSRMRHPVAEVLSRDSVFALAVRDKSIHEAARRMDADLALTGTIAALPLYYRLRAEMIRVVDGVQLWVEDFLVPRNLLSHADARIAKQIGARIQNSFAYPAGELSQLRIPRKGSSESSAAPASPELERRRADAFALQMKARFDWDTVHLPQMRNAISGLERALELDPDLHSARFTLMHSYLAFSSFGHMRADIAAELARKQAEALKAHSSLSAAVEPAMGWIHFFHDRDMAAANTSFGRSSGSGYNPWTAGYLARFALGQGRMNDAIGILRAALGTDPYSPSLHSRLAWALHLAGESEAALEQANHALYLFPNHPSTMFFGATILAASESGHEEFNQAGQSSAARAVSIATQLVQIEPGLDAGFALLAYAQARQGRIVEARALLDRQQHLSQQRFVMRSFEAPALVELGEHDAAIEILNRAEKQHCSWLFELLGDPRLKPLHREPEFRRLSDMSGHRLAENASVA